ncbi:DUF418 domain-containing protein [Altererythrobacter sp. H2]|uniref:DUF418 domain-containing protein n=1 Tax=Altererythrobacter sp. H2 TaxID=3108391 RepID=UPI002B4BCDF7|nr:DUF418 domain-containing protein [Altererythrobacter sp. H2]WRK95567.1 DUF418 domain-containing protein [Altererythrobacter sp. H2]
MEQGQAVSEGAVAPVAGTGRIGSLDFTRGIAVMGILAANIVAFGQPFSAYMYPAAFLTDHGESSNWLWIAQFVLIDGKMRGLFTLLFGAGMYLFMEKAWARGASRWLQARRLFWLLLFGMFHFFFIWRGDILTYYALLGLGVLLCLGWSARTQLVVGVLGYLVGALLYAAMLAPLHFIAETDFGKQPDYSEMRSGLLAEQESILTEDQTDTDLTVAGDYAGLTAHRFAAHGDEQLTNLLLFGFETFPLMLLGVGLFRIGFFSGQLDRRRMLVWGWAGLLLGGGLHLLIGLWVKGIGYSYYGTLAAFVGISPVPRLMMVVGMAALLTVWAPTATGWLGQRVTAAGRAAFTNYLGTSIVMMFVFHGWALGLFGKLDRVGLYVVVALTCALMLAWSKPWLERFRYGPLDWLWRCLTYGKLFPMRR